MGDYFRHKASGDAVTVLFRYHHSQPDLFLEVLDTAKRLIGNGTLATYCGGYSVGSWDYPEIQGKTLCLGGKRRDTNIDESVKCKYASVEDRNNALYAFCVMIDQICGNAPGTSIPEFLGGAPKNAVNPYTEPDMTPAEEVINKLFGGDSMFSKNGSLQNVLGGEVKVVMPGFNASNVAINKPKDKDFVHVVITDKDGNVADKFELGLLPGYPVSIGANALDGVLTITAKYDRGAEIPVATGDTTTVTE